MLGLGLLGRSDNVHQGQTLLAWCLWTFERVSSTSSGWLSLTQSLWIFERFCSISPKLVATCVSFMDFWESLQHEPRLATLAEELLEEAQAWIVS